MRLQKVVTASSYGSHPSPSFVKFWRVILKNEAVYSNPEKPYKTKEEEGRGGDKEWEREKEKRGRERRKERRRGRI